MSILMKWDPDGHLYRQLHLGKHRIKQLEQMKLRWMNTLGWKWNKRRWEF